MKTQFLKNAKKRKRGEGGVAGKSNRVGEYDQSLLHTCMKMSQ
jgi:hypothetical protein